MALNLQASAQLPHLTHFSWINPVTGSPVSGNGGGRTISHANPAAFAFILQNTKVGQGGTLSGTAVLIQDMFLVFCFEIPDGGYDRIGSALSQAAQGGFLHGGRNLL